MALLLLFSVAITSAQKIAAGWSHSLYLCSNGSTVNAWGADTLGQLGNGQVNTNPHPVPGTVNNLTGVKAIKAGYEHCIALKNDSTVWTWGSNIFGQLGNGTNTNSTAPVQVSGLSGVIAVSGGQAGYHSLALKADGTVWTWGKNTEGQLGDGTLTNSNVPVQVPGLTGIIAIAGGEYHSLALKNDGTVWAWGRNSNGQLGNNTTTLSSQPVQVYNLTGITSIRGGRYWSMALRSDSTVWTWGQNGDGQLGNGTNTQSLIPVQVAGLTEVIAIAGSAFHGLALKNDGTIRAWGRGSDGQLGDGLIAASNVPVQVAGINNAVEIVSGTNYSFALTATDSIYAWGRNIYGQLGDGSSGNYRYSPVATTGLCATSSVKFALYNISAGWSHSLSICSNDSSLNSWGANLFGQLGNGITSTNPDATPGAVTGLTGVVSIAAGYQHNLALVQDSNVWAWGDNVDGQLGNGNNTASSVPVHIPGLTEVISVSGGTAGYHSLALKADGTVWAWGRNSDGQLGNGTNVSSNVPVQVSNLNNIVAISGGEYHSLAIRNDGTVWAWGRNGNGQLGNNTSVNSNIPVQVIGMTGAVEVAAGRFYSFALRADSTVWSWGENLYGQLGDGTNNNNRLTPVQTIGLTDITAIAGGAFHSLAIKSDKTVLSWGRNTYGNLGDGSTTNSSLPIAVSLLTNVVAIDCGTNYSLALRGDDSLFAFGRNTFGQLGDSLGVEWHVPHGVQGLCRSCVNTSSSITATSCGAYTSPSGNQTFTASGIYTDVIPNSGGCDSVITINLTIDTVNINVTQNSETLTAEASGATYQWLNCSNGYSAIANATGQTYTATANGSYAVVVTKNNCSDTSVCYAVVSIGIEDVPASLFAVYPNPSITGRYQFANSFYVENLEVYNLLGERVLKASAFNSINEVIDLSNLANGSYFMTVKSGDKYYQQKLIKQ